VFFAIFKGKILNLGRGKEPGSEIRDPEKNHPVSRIRIPDPWGKKVPDPGSRIRIRNTDRYQEPFWSRNIVNTLKFINVNFSVPVHDLIF
jgi:hypothetical protein